MEILIEYYFIIKHAKGSKNLRMDILSRKSELQLDKKVTGAILRKNTDRKIRYNYPQLIATYKAPILILKAKIKEVQKNSLEEYTEEDRIFILEEITKEFVTEFYKGMTQGHNRVSALVSRLQEEYIVLGV